MRCGVDTDTSTPHISLNIHSFFGLLTRATTRGTPNSCLASSEMTRLSSSSPVAGGDDVGVGEPGSGERAELAGVAGDPAGRPGVGLAARSGLTSARSLSRIVTSWLGARQLLGDEAADAAASGDDDLHQCPLPWPAPATASVDAGLIASSARRPGTRCRPPG